jgi:DNA-binding PadR family transcriptional regulator
MSPPAAELHVLHRFAEKCRLAGGAKAGYVLRRRSLEQGWDRARAGQLDEALDALVGRGVLAVNEARDRFVLTEQGVEALAAG